MKVLVDTSAWVDFLNGYPSKEHAALASLIGSDDEICTCGVIVAEVFQGLKQEKGRKDLERLFRKLVFLEPDRVDSYLRAAAVYRSLRARGHTVRSTIDCLIAVLAEEAGCYVLARDRDLTAILGSGLLKARLLVLPRDDVNVGQRLGSYEITGAIGAGGMGEVYRARDTKLSRDVAIKVLPEAFASDPERLSRFTREAQTLASLNHPSIAAIYGIEEAPSTTGSGSGVRALVMEMVEGEDLSAHIARGPIPITEALPIARQIAEALEAAHEHGIIHRDLKPANIKIRVDGTVKVLDFGLAKAFESDGGAANSQISHSPTMSRHATEAGLILGTAAYMSPEQARGKPVDKRADIWSFGVVLFEMLTQRRAFAGADVTEVLAAVIRDAPDFGALPPGTPTAVRRLLRRCLEKDRAKRLDSMRAVQLEIHDAMAGVGDEATGGGVTTMADGPLRPWWRRFALPAALALTASILVAVLLRPAPADLNAVSRFEINLPPGAVLRGLSLTPDGRSLVYSVTIRSNTSTTPEISRLYRRDLDRLDSQPIPGSDGAESPWVSPDGAWVAFRVNRTSIKKMRLAGGPMVPIADDRQLIRGLAWEPSGQLLVGSHEGGLKRVASAGDSLKTVTDAVGAAPHRFPRVLPDGRGVLFMIGGSDTRDQVAVLPAGATQWRVLTSGSHPQYLPTGHLVFWRDKSLWAAPFDLKRLELTAEPVPVVDNVLNDDRALFEWSSDGTLFYAVEGSRQSTTLSWVDRSGRDVPLSSPAANFGDVWLSPNGQKALARQGNRLWLYDLQRGGSGERLTSDNVAEWTGLWSADGRDVIFMSRRQGPFDIYRTNISGTRSIEPLGIRDGNPIGWARDGASLLHQSGTDLYVRKPAEQKSELLVREDGFAGGTVASVSPDGRFVAFQLASDPPALAIRPLPDPNANRWLIPIGGRGSSARWSANGRELFYRTGTAMMSIPVAPSGDRPFGAAQRLFDDAFGQPWDVAPDGRFLMVKEPQGVPAGDRIVVVRNWFAELNKAVPIR